MRYREPQLTTQRRAQIWNCALQPAPEQLFSELRHWVMHVSVQLLLLPSARSKQSVHGAAACGAGARVWE
jgi:hypothetical protein